MATRDVLHRSRLLISAIHPRIPMVLSDPPTIPADVRELSTVPTHWPLVSDATTSVNAVFREVAVLCTCSRCAMWRFLTLPAVACMLARSWVSRSAAASPTPPAAACTST
eukprot:728926-Pyramimonas_sp.AAC.2